MTPEVKLEFEQDSSDAAIAATQQAPPASRASTGKKRYHTKSRKGCATCKRRRVKCDETKPRCNKCDHMGLECVYVAPVLKPKKTNGIAKKSQIAPKPIKVEPTIPLLDPGFAAAGGKIDPAAFAADLGSNRGSMTEPSLQPSLSPTIPNSPPLTAASPLSSPLTTLQFGYNGTLNMLDLRLMYHYTTKVWPTITAAGISEEKIWSDDIPMLAFKYPFLMHSVLAFSATHLSRTERGLDQCVTCHRGDALRLLREAVLEMSDENTDALVAAALILIMDSLANASLPSTSSSPQALPPSAWIFHVRGAATILTAVWPLSEVSRFYKFISIDLGDLGDIGLNMDNTDEEPMRYSTLECFDPEIADLYPVPFDSPYLRTLAYLNRLQKERKKSDFILRVFAFPALLDKTFLGLLIGCDISAMRIMRCYYKLLRNFTAEMKDRVWFLEGVSSVLPVDVEQYTGGGGMNMMLDFLGGPSTFNDSLTNDIDDIAAQSGLLDTDNLPSSITDVLDVNDGFMGLK